MDLQRVFEARADTIGAIRAFVQEVMVRQGCVDEAIDAAVLCTSELATNALLHGDGELRVEVRLNGRAHVSVCDRNPGMPVPRRGAPEDDAGRGLLLVGLFADRWGSEPTDDGKRVWFEIDAQRAFSQAW
jgi:anti-sigma regulatory factor (Ser/Thr protein kinase)